MREEITNGHSTESTQQSSLIANLSHGSDSLQCVPQTLSGQLAGRQQLGGLAAEGQREVATVGLTSEALHLQEDCVEKNKALPKSK